MNASSGFFVAVINAKNNTDYYSHFEKAVRAIRDLPVMCLSIKEASENITSNAQASLYWFDLNLDLRIHHSFVRIPFWLL